MEHNISYFFYPWILLIDSYLSYRIINKNYYHLKYKEVKFQFIIRNFPIFCYKFL